MLKIIARRRTSRPRRPIRHDRDAEAHAHATTKAQRTRKSRQATQAWRTEQHATKHIVQDSTHTTHIHIQKSPLRRLPFCTSCTWYFANSMQRACASEPVELPRSCLDRLEAPRKRSGCNSPTLARKDRSRATRAHRHPVYAQSITSLCCCRKETFKLQKRKSVDPPSKMHLRCYARRRHTLKEWPPPYVTFASRQPQGVICCTPSTTPQKDTSDKGERPPLERCHHW